MKIFDKFMVSDKRDELIIRYFDKSMSAGVATMVFPLKSVRNGDVTYDSIERDLVGFNEFSKVKIKDVFALLKKPSKQICLRNIGKE